MFLIGMFVGGVGVFIPMSMELKDNVDMENIKYLENVLDEPKTIEVEEHASSRTKLSAEEWQWEFQDMNGNVQKLEDLKGKVILLNYWTTWCKGCVAELPSLLQLQKRVGNNEQFKLLYFTPESSAKVKRFLQKRPDLDKRNLQTYDKASLPKIFYSGTIPHTIIIDKNGEIRVRHTGAVLWDSDKVVDLVNKLTME